ncbi:MAG: agl cluster protein AglQ [Myxococcota bacterium]|nr:agl cluster protein AglQ [Myxococcota bacterium]
MTGLHELLVRSAAAALPAQRDDGSFAAGRNGPYGDAETPVRNTGHWLVSLCAAWTWTREARFREAALAATRHLASEKARPGGATFLHRDKPGKDACNGLVGQAWSIEALAAAAEAFEAPHLSELAERVFLLHPFDGDLGLWRRVEVDGSELTWDATFNHQLWFAASGALIAPFASPEVAARVHRFLDRVPRNLGLHASGLVRHVVTARPFAWREPRLAVRLLRTRAAEGPEHAHKEAGYHAFNLYAFALLRRHAPDHPCWRSEKFRRLWRYARRPGFRRAVASNPYGWPYNPTGIEMAFALETLEGPGARGEAGAWLADQLGRHWDAGASQLRRGTPDPDTLAARLYEATRLSDLELAPGLCAHRTRGDEPRPGLGTRDEPEPRR